MVDTNGMGIMDRAREAADQARATMAARPADEEPVAAEEGAEPVSAPTPPPHRSAFSAFADKLDPGALADLVQKAGAMQEKVNATLRERGLNYRISEVCFTATFPPQVSFYIASTPPPPSVAAPSAEKPTVASKATKATKAIAATKANKAVKAVKAAPQKAGLHKAGAKASEREDSNLQPPASDAGALPLRHVQQMVLTVGFEPTLAAV